MLRVSSSKIVQYCSTVVQGLSRVALLLFLGYLVACGTKVSSSDNNHDTSTILKTQALVLSDDIRLTANIATQGSPVLAYDSVNRNYLVVWVDYRNYNNTSTDIYGRLCSATELLNGTCSSSEIVISDDTATETEPAVQFDPVAQKYLVVWTDGTHRALRGRFVNRDGTLSDVFDIRTVNTPSQPDVVYNNITKKFDLTWREENNFEPPVTVQGLSCTNTYTFTLQEPYADSYMIVTGSIDSSGTVSGITSYSLRAWLSYSDTGSISGVLGVYNKESNPAVFNDPVTGDLYVAWSAEQNPVNVSVTYQCPENTQPPCPCIYQANISGGGDTYPKVYVRKKTPGMFYDLTFSSGASYYPAVTVDPITRRALVVWEEQGSNGKDINGEVINLSNFTGYQSVSVSGAPYDQTRPEVAYDSVNQRFMVIWEDARNGSINIPNIDIYGQFVDPQGQLSGSNFPVTTVPQNQLAPQIAYGDSGFPYFFLVWKDGRDPGNADIYGNLWQYSVAPQIEITDENNQPLTADTLNFGSVKAGQNSLKIFRIWNNGNSQLTIIGHQGPNLPFSVSTEWPSVINPGTFYDMTVVFTPQSKGSFNDRLVIQSNGGQKTIYLSGNGMAPDISVVPSSIDFGSVIVGTEATAELIISNSGNAELIVDSITVDKPYSVETQTPLRLQPGEKQVLTVRFAPSEQGTFTKTLTIRSDDPDTGTVTVNLTGTGIVQSGGQTEDTNKKKGSLSCSISGPVDKPSAIADMIVLLIPVVYLLLRSKRFNLI
jgi:hypothetical protein